MQIKMTPNTDRSSHRNAARWRTHADQAWTIVAPAAHPLASLSEAKPLSLLSKPNNKFKSTHSSPWLHIKLQTGLFLLTETMPNTF